MLLKKGIEKDVYPGEIRDIVLTALSNAVKSMPEHSRSADVIRDIVSHNDYEQLGRNHAEKIKEMMRNYTGMNRKLRTSFEDMGFVFTTHSKHINAYYGDERYKITFSSTPSDSRTGKNLASDIIRICF